MKPVAIGAALALALSLTTSLASAETGLKIAQAGEKGAGGAGMSGGGGGAAGGGGGGAMRSGGGEARQGGGERGGQAQRGEAGSRAQQGRDGGSRAEAPQKGNRSAGEERSQKQHQQKSRAAEQKQSGQQHQQQRAEQQRAEQQKREAAQANGKQQGKQPNQKQAEPKQGTPQQGTAQAPRDKRDDRVGNAKDRPGDRQTAGRDGARDGSRVQLSDEQRTRVRQTLLSQKVQVVRNARFEHRVGARIPRSVRLFVIPAAIYTIVPEYRNYRYFVVDDEICIVDPRSYEVVTVLDSSGGGGGRLEARGGAGGGQVALVLSQDDRMFVLEHVDMQAEARLGIGDVQVGMNIPSNVRLMTFPDVVIERLPKLRPYRYFVFENEVAIVEPGAGRVALVIDDNAGRGGRR